MSQERRIDPEEATWGWRYEFYVYRDGEKLMSCEENATAGMFAVADAFDAEAIFSIHKFTGELRHWVKGRSTGLWRRATIESFRKRVPRRELQ